MAKIQTIVPLWATDGFLGIGNLIVHRFNAFVVVIFGAIVIFSLVLWVFSRGNGYAAAKGFSSIEFIFSNWNTAAVTFGPLLFWRQRRV